MKVDGIENGIVLDHITAGKGMLVYKYLHLDRLTSQVALIQNCSSGKMGRKDIVKIEDRELDQNTVDKIALIAPQATIVIIRDYYVANKFKVDIGNHVVGLARCSNPDCITNKGEPIEPEFDVISKNPPVLRCMYCERKLTNISDNLL